MVGLAIAGGAAPTVAQLNAERSDGLAGLVAFLFAVPTSHEAAIFYASLIALAIGFFASWWIKYAIAKTVDDCVLPYFFETHTRRTMGAVGVYVSSVILAITSGAFENAGAFTGWYNVFYVCITSAMAADGTLNKGSQGGWSDEQRAAARAATTEVKP